MKIVKSLKATTPRPLLAAAGNVVMKLRGDPRRFGVDHDGHWINIQPDATFVSPDIYTPYFRQIREGVLDYWCQFYRPHLGDTIIDVGAGIGEDAVVFSRLVGPKGKVISIEAHPDTFACLQATIDLSRLGNVVAVQCAIADADGTLTMSDESEHLANSVLKNGAGIVVPARSLDSLIHEIGIGEIALLKMNIEGAERAAMAGLSAIAPRIRNVAISCHDFVADSGAGDQFRTRSFVKQRLEELGFTIRQRENARHPWLRDTLFGDHGA